MFGVIQLSEVVFGAHVLSLTAAKASLSDVKASFPSHQSSSKVLDLYQAEFEALSLSLSLPMLGFWKRTLL